MIFSTFVIEFFIFLRTINAHAWLREVKSSNPRPAISYTTLQTFCHHGTASTLYASTAVFPWRYDAGFGTANLLHISGFGVIWRV